MKILEAIEKLQRQYDKHGNIELMVNDDDTDTDYTIDDNIINSVDIDSKKIDKAYFVVDTAEYDNNFRR